MGDQRQRLAEQWLCPPRLGVVLHPGVAGERTDPNPVDARLNRVEFGDPVDVHDVGGFGQTHRQHRDERLAAGQHLAVVPHLGEHRDGLGDGCRSVPDEGRRFHL